MACLVAYVTCAGLCWAGRQVLLFDHCYSYSSVHVVMVRLLERPPTAWAVSNGRPQVVEKDGLPYYIHELFTLQLLCCILLHSIGCRLWRRTGCPTTFTS